MLMYLYFAAMAEFYDFVNSLAPFGHQYLALLPHSSQPVVFN